MLLFVSLMSLMAVGATAFVGFDSDPGENAPDTGSEDDTPEAEGVEDGRHVKINP